MEPLAVMALLAFGGAVVAFKVNQRRAGRQLETARRGDAVETLLHFLQTVNARLDPATAAAVRGVALETYDAEVCEYIRIRLREQPLPTVQEA